MPTRKQGRPRRSINYKQLNERGFCSEVDLQNTPESDEEGGYLSEDSPVKHIKVPTSEIGAMEEAIQMPPDQSADSLAAYKTLQESEIDEELRKAEQKAELLRAEKAKSDKILALMKLKMDNARAEANIKDQTAQITKVARGTSDPQKRCSKVVGKPPTKKATGEAAPKQHKLLNIKDLRSNPRLQKQVNNTLDLLGLHDDDSDSTTSDPPSEIELQRQRIRARGKKRGKVASHKQSRSRDSHKYDSDSDSYQSLLWPHENLGPKYSNYDRAVFKYKQLDFRLFVAGELNIIFSTHISDHERLHRGRLLSDTVFNAGYYEWHAILKLHAAILTEIESGQKEWDSDFARLEQQMLMPFPLRKKGDRKQEKVSDKRKHSNVSKVDKGTDDEKVLYCSDYQKGQCNQGDTHSANFFGRTATVQHICASCWLRGKSKQNHPDTDPDCPHNSH